MAQAKAKQERSRRWVVTLHHIGEAPGEPSLEEARSVVESNSSLFRRVLLAKEYGAAGETPHLQGYVVFNTAQRLSKLAALFGARNHFLVMKGDVDHSEVYCRKEGNELFEFGDPIAPGKRNDIVLMHERVVEGKDDLEIAEEMPTVWYKYHKGIEKQRQLLDVKNTPLWRPVTVKVYYGRTRTGKTRAATTENSSVYLWKPPYKWCQAYCGEQRLVIDEYNNQQPIHWLLSFLDNYRILVECKGSHSVSKWSEVVVTTNIPVEQWHLNAKEEHIDALLARIDEIQEFPLRAVRDKSVVKAEWLRNTLAQGSRGCGLVLPRNLRDTEPPCQGPPPCKRPRLERQNCEVQVPQQSAEQCTCTRDDEMCLWCPMDRVAPRQNGHDFVFKD